MKKICISKDWFFKGPDDQDFVPVDLPHDYAISRRRSAKAPGGGGNGYFEGGVGLYHKYFTPPEAEHVILDVDGAYMCATISVNDQQMAIHPHGYTPFLLDITDELWAGRTNKITIHTNDLQPSARWYAGAGLYRDVFLWTGGKVRIEPWDIFVTTPQADEKTACVKADCQLTSDLTGRAVLEARIADAKGKTVAESSVTVSVLAGEKSPATLSFLIDQPQLWDVDNPYLYTLHTKVAVDGRVCDESETVFGVRTISVDARNGFRLNGKPMKMRGGCIHHDHGVLGGVALPAAEERKIRLLKEAGFNAVRIAHNPPSLAMLEVCDRLGMLVMDEAFDMWNIEKRPGDYHLFFADWWARDIRYMVERDRNHPCVIAYSTGNEIVERDGRANGAAWSAKLAAEVRRYDATRPVTNALCGMWLRPASCDPAEYHADYLKHRGAAQIDTTHEEWQRMTEDFVAPLDIVGYNYMYMYYEQDHARYPERVMWGSETHAINFYHSWKATMECPWVLGDFTWTAIDNLGEAGTGRALWARDGVIPGISIADYPWRTCYQGDLDLCGYRRPQSYFREAVWLGDDHLRIFTTHPEHYGEGFTGTKWHWYDVLDTWTFEDAYLGKPVKVEAYTTADEVVFLLNGREAGRSIPEAGIATVDIPYERGEVTAIALRGGKECARASIHTVGAEAAVQVKAEQASFTADRRDLCYFDITVVDGNGERVPNAKSALCCTVEGGELMGIFSGDPCNEDQYTSPECHAFEGRALAIVRTDKPGSVTITIEGDGLASGSASAQAL